MNFWNQLRIDRNLRELFRAIQKFAAADFHLREQLFDVQPFAVRPDRTCTPGPCEPYTVTLAPSSDFFPLFGEAHSRPGVRQ